MEALQTRMAILMSDQKHSITDHGDAKYKRVHTVHIHIRTCSAPPTSLLMIIAKYMSRFRFSHPGVYHWAHYVTESTGDSPLRNRSVRFFHRKEGCGYIKPSV